ncbi:peptidase S8/S53 domain-containing protein, partial [Dichotomocladium elegans]
PSVPQLYNETNRYIVVLKPTADILSIVNHIQQVQPFRANHTLAKSTASNNSSSSSSPSAEPDKKYSSIGNLRWYSGEFYSSSFESAIPSDGIVHYWMKDVPVSLQELVQTNPPSWGLDRIDQREGMNGQYRFPTSQGSGTTVYILDTGVMGDHNELQGRVTYGPSFIDSETDDSDTDANGHGTFVAGVCCGTTHGVAKQANIVSLKTLDDDGNGMLSDLLEGLAWVVQHHKPGDKAIVNLSLGAMYNQVANDAVAQAVGLGIHVVVAAGNYGEDACKYSPGSAPGAITVGAIDSDDGIAYYSNFGKCVDIFAPGTDIESIWSGKPDAVKIQTGTSMAAPHVAGAIALFLAEKDYTPDEMQYHLKHVSSLVNEQFVIDDMGNANKTVLDNAIHNGWKTSNYRDSGTIANLLFTHPDDGGQLWVYGTSRTSA